jgi:hypothetical protein
VNAVAAHKKYIPRNRDIFGEAACHRNIGEAPAQRVGNDVFCRAGKDAGKGIVPGQLPDKAVTEMEKEYPIKKLLYTAGILNTPLFYLPGLKGKNGPYFYTV